MNSRTAFLFPGQGSYLPGLFGNLVDHFPVIGETLSTVDDVATGLGRAPVSPMLLDADSPTLQELVDHDPPALHLAIFAASVATARLLAEEGGVAPDLLLGHSFGELTALTAAGAVSLADGAYLVAQRDESLRGSGAPRGGLVALGCGARRARDLLGALDEWDLAVAADNGPDQVAVSGPDGALARLQEVAGALGLTATRLRIPYPFHNRLMLDAADDFGERTADVPKRVPRLRVYSSLLGRYVEDVADVERVVRGHLVLPVLFLDAVRAVHADGVRRFAEAGPKGVLVDLVSRVLPDVVTAAPLRRRTDRRGLLATVEELLERDDRRAPAPSRAARAPEPREDAAPARPAGRWQERAAARREQPPAPSRYDDPPTPAGHGRYEDPPAPAGREQAPPTRYERPAAPARGERQAPDRRGLPAAPDRPEPVPAASGPDREQVLGTVRRLYAELVGYPEDVFESGTDLEADLGIDSIKQTEAFARITDHFGIPESAAVDVRLTGYPTVDAVADLVVELAEGRELTGTVA